MPAALAVVNFREVGNPTSLAAFLPVKGNPGDTVSTADKHREWAAACLRLAQNATDDESRSLYLMMAEAWRALAEKSESRETSDD